jgi:hypothetical protein
MSVGFAAQIKEMLKSLACEVDADWRKNPGIRDFFQSAC